MDPDTKAVAYDLISDGKVVEGYTLIYLQQIRDLLEVIASRVKQFESQK